MAEKTIGRHLIPLFLAAMDAKSKATEDTYRKALHQFFNFMEERAEAKGTDPKQLMDPQKIDIRKYRDSLMDANKSAITITSYLTAVRKFFAWTQETGIHKDVAKYVKGVTLDKEHERKDFLTAEQVKTVLEAIDTSDEAGKRNYALVYLMVTTGLLGIEIERAKVQDIRLLDDKIVLHVQGKGKQDKNDYVLLPEEADNRLKDYWACRTQLTGNSPLFARLGDAGDGKALCTRAMRILVKNCFSAVGIEQEYTSTQSLRDTAGMLALIHNQSVKSVQEYLRHNNLQSTLVYATHISKLSNTCADTVAEAIRTA